jgi:TP901 family phage tail tape measure protein
MIEINVTGNATQSLQQIQTEARRSDTSIKSLVATFATFSLAERAVKGVISTFSDMQQALLDIQKTTGLAGKGLDELTGALDKLSVTNRGMEVESLYKIASIAGQLGIKGKENILSFTEEIKKLSVTSTLTAEQAGEAFAQLSNSLGEPISNIRKLSSTFTALASSTTASEEVLVNYVQRLSGAGVTLGLTTSQIAGLGATLKDVGLTAELSTTAMSQVFMKFMTDTKTITDTLNLDFEEFSRVVKEEPNKALLIFLDTLGQLDKASKVQALKDMKMAGAGLSSTLLKLSSNTDKLVQNMNTASQAYIEGTATQKEYEVSSQSLRAKQEQLTSAVKLSAYSLGKELEPTLVTIINTLTPLAQWVGENSKQIITLTKVVLSGVVAWKSLNLVMSLSPFGRVVAGLTAVITVAWKAYHAIRAVFTAQKEGEAKTKAYLEKINSEAYKNEQKIKQLTTLTQKQAQYTKAIELTTKMLNSPSLTATQKKALEQNLAMQGQKLNSLILQRRELEKQVNISKGVKAPSITPTATSSIKVPEPPKITVPEIDTSSIKKIASEMKTATGIATSNASKMSKEVSKEVKRTADTLNRFENDYIEAINGRYASERKQLKDKYNEYAKVVKDKSKLDRWYQAELSKINKRESDEVTKKQKEIEDKRKQSLEKQLKIDEQFQDKFQRATLNRYEYARVQLDKEYEKYKQTVSDKTKLDEWYQAELAKINKQEQDEIDRKNKAIEEKHRQALERQKRIDEAFNKEWQRATMDKTQLQEVELKKQYDKYKQTVTDQKKVDEWYQAEYQKIVQAKIDKEIEANQKILEEARKRNEALANDLNKYISQFSNIVIDVGVQVDRGKLDALFKDMSSIIAEGINEGFSNADYSKLGGSVAGVLSSVLANQYTANSTKSQQVGGQVGGAIGGAVGTAYGGAIGGAIGEGLGSIIGSWAGGGLFGGKKTDYVYIDEAGNAVYVTRTSGGQWGKDKFRADEAKSLQLQETLEKQLDSINSLFTRLGTDTSVTMQTLYESLGGVADVYKVKVKNFDEAMSNVVLEALGNGTNTEELTKIWGDYAESVQQTTLEAIGGALQEIGNAQNKVFEYLNKDNETVILERRLETLQVAEQQLEATLGLGDVTLQNYDEMVSKLIEVGNVTPETTSALAQLSDVLIAQAEVTEQVNQVMAESQAQLAQAVSDAQTQVQDISTDKGTNNIDGGENDMNRWGDYNNYDYAGNPSGMYFTSTGSLSYTPQSGDGSYDLEEETKKAEEALQRAKEARADELTQIIETNKQLEISSKVFLINFRNSLKDSIDDLTQLELERLEQVKDGFVKSFDSLDAQLRKLRGIEEGGDSVDRTSSIVEYNRVLAEISNSKSLTESEFTDLQNRLTQSLSSLDAYAKDGSLSTSELISYTEEAKRGLEAITVVKDSDQTEAIEDNTEEIETQTRILESINRVLGEDKSVVEVDNNKLADLLESTDLNYIQTQQLVNAFSDNLLTTDELLGIKGLTSDQQDIIVGQTGIEIEKALAIDEQLDYLASIKEENKSTNEKLSSLEYLFTVNAQEVRNQRVLLEELIDSVTVEETV